MRIGGVSLRGCAAPKECARRLQIWREEHGQGSRPLDLMDMPWVGQLIYRTQPGSVAKRVVSATTMVMVAIFLLPFCIAGVGTTYTISRICRALTISKLPWHFYPDSSRLN